MMRKRITLIAMLLAFLLSLCVPVHARDLASGTVTAVPGVIDAAAKEEEPSEEEPGDEEKAAIAGNLLADVIKLVGKQYAGGETSPELLYEAALRGISEVLDPYSQYYSEEELAQLEQSLSGSIYGIGVRLGSEEGALTEVKYVVPGSPAEKVGMLAGDILVEVNGVLVEGMDAAEIVEIIAGTDEKAKVSFRRGDAKHSVEMVKELIQVDTVEVSKIEDVLESAKESENSRLRHVRLSEFGEKTAAEFKEALAKMKSEGVSKIILDLRGNPGGYAHITVELCNMIVPKGPIMYTIDKNGNKKEVSSNLSSTPFEKIALLTDEGTASAAEVLASALQDSSAAVVIGGNTFGKGLIQSLFPLPAGGALKLTTEKYLRRSGGEINEIGVIPDIPIALPEIVTTSVNLDKTGSSEAVPIIRKMVSGLGYEAKAPSDPNSYDESLKDAIKLFQKDHSLDSTGVLDDETIFELDRAVYREYFKLDPPLQKAYELLTQE
jgi:carboxyl-terminal processing protease